MADAINSAPSALSAPPPFHIGFATSPQDLQDVAELFLEYTSSLGIDLAYQSFAEELSGLPGKYAAPYGVLLLARSVASTSSDTGIGKPIGCVALRPLPLPSEKVATAYNSSKGAHPDYPGQRPPSRRCELKRLYVRSDARGTGLGEALARRALDEAVARGYSEVVMDTLSSMESARRLYTKLRFVETAAYYETPIVETVFYLRALP